MRLERIDNAEARMEIVEEMLKDIEGVSPNSLYKNEIRETPTTFYLGYIGDVPLCVVETNSQKVEELFLTNFGVIKKFQGKGKGAFFLNLLEKIAKQNGHKSLRLISHPDAYGFYLACGYYKKNGSEFGLQKQF